MGKNIGGSGSVDKTMLASGKDKGDNNSMHSLVSLKDVTVTRAGSRMLGPLSWQLLEGRHTAITGRNGSGKTTLMRLLRGEIPPDIGGERVYDFGSGSQHTVLGLRHEIGMVSPDMQEFYFLHTPNILGRSVILGGFYDSPILYGEATPEQERLADGVAARLEVEDLARSELRTLSTGQVRKLLIARAVASGPRILLLDECLDGLDATSRSEVLQLLDTVAGQATLVCAAHRAGDLPESIDHTVVMEEGHIVAEGRREAALGQLQNAAPDMVACRLPVVPAPTQYNSLLRMEHVSVVVDGECILHPLDWEMLPGENWMIIGQNGAGKSTLLKLIMSEIAPYADDETGEGVIERLGGMTMDLARSRIGVVSPDLQARYARELGWEVTAEETVMSGFRGSVGMLEEPTSREKLEAWKWLEAVGLKGLEEKRLRHMSYGQQRRVFLARAVAPGPDLLLLDEPFSGLDTPSRAMMIEMVQQLAEAGTPIVLVSHHAGDRVPAINRVMALERGRCVFCGSKTAFDFSKIME